jgi:monoamine oxidase
VSDSRGITRRQIVAGAAGAALALGAGVPLAGCGGDEGRRGRGRVVVVGAGLAGLTAAFELDRKGWEVTVLEARDRVGGRCRTFRRELRFGQVAEAGGEFIDAGHDAVRGYAKSFGLELDDLREAEDDDLADAFYESGRLRDRERVLDEDVQGEIDRFDEEIDRYTAAIDVADPARTGAGLDTRSVGDLLDELQLDPDARAIIEAGLRTEYGVEPDRLSLLFHVVLSAITREQSDEDTERYRIRGGNDRLPNAFADKLRESLVLKAPVESIQSRQSRVRVVAGREEVDADYCVVALPLPALRAVRLDAELPRAVRDAIARVQYGDATKTVLEYESRFWADEGWSGDVLTDLPIQATWDATPPESATGGVLMTYAAAGDAARLGGLPPRDRVGEAADQVEQIFSDTDADPRDTFVSGATVAWGKERFSGGSYSAWAPGQYTRYWPVMRRAHGRIYFAGEHTDLYASYMEGAVRSGRRVASEIEARGA